MLVGYNPHAPRPTKLFQESPDSVVYQQDSEGRINKIIETFGVNVKVTDTTFNTDGSVNTVAITLDGKKRTETYAYNPDGTISSMSSNEVDV